MYCATSKHILGMLFSRNYWMDGLMIPKIILWWELTDDKIIDIWFIYQKIFVSFENIFVSEAFADYFI